MARQLLEAIGYLPACELSLEVDPPASVRRAGQELVGRVHVRARERARCEALTLTLTRTSRTKEGKESAVVERITLFRGRWQPGDEESYSFRLRLPTHPWSYQGELVQIGWSLAAEARLRRAADVTAELPLQIAPPARPAVTVTPADNRGPEHRWGRGCFLTSVALLLSALAVVVMLREVISLQGVVGAAVVLAQIGIAGLVVSLRPYLAGRRLGAVEVSVGPAKAAGYREADRGEALDCAVRLRPDSAVRAVTAALLVMEEAPGQVGKDGWRRHVLYEHRAHLAPRAGAGASASGDGIAVYVGRLPLPVRRGLPLPWSSSTARIVWQVKVHVDVDRWPDFHEKLTLDVRPGPAS